VRSIQWSGCGPEVRYPAVAAGLVLLQTDRSEYCTHPAFCSMPYDGSVRGSKAVGTWSWQLTSFSAEVKESCCNHTSHPGKPYSAHWDYYYVRIPNGASWGPPDFQNTYNCKCTLMRPIKHVPSKLNFHQYVCFLHLGCRCSYGTFPTAGLIHVPVRN
jgi:hypothetical protein